MLVSLFFVSFIAVPSSLNVKTKEKSNAFKEIKN
jgi:hypothetical protein